MSKKKRRGDGFPPGTPLEVKRAVLDTIAQLDRVWGKGRRAVCPRCRSEHTFPSGGFQPSTLDGKQVCLDCNTFFYPPMPAGWRERLADVPGDQEVPAVPGQEDGGL